MKRIATITKRDNKGNVIAISCPGCPDNRNCVDASDMVDECENYAVMGGIEYCNQDCFD